MAILQAFTEARPRWTLSALSSEMGLKEDDDTQNPLCAGAEGFSLANARGH
jgi:hypothetical protein